MDLNDKDVIILGGTGKYLTEQKNGGVEILDKFYPDENIKEYKCGKNTYTKYDNKDGDPPIIEVPHPSARFGNEPQAETIAEILNEDVIEESVNKDSSGLDSIGTAIKTAYASTKKWIKANPKTTVTVVAGVAIAITVVTLYAKKSKKKK